MKIKLLVAIFTTLFFTSGFSQSNCEAEFNSGDVLRWRNQLSFIPKYLTTQKMDYVTNNLSNRDYFQLHIDITVYCDDKIKKNNLMSNMQSFWDNRISMSTLNSYFPAYYIFYQIDKAGIGSSDINYPSEQKSILPFKKSELKNEANGNIITDLYLTYLFNRDLIKKSYSFVKNNFLDKPLKTFVNSSGRKVIYWNEKGINISFNFDSQDRCVYFRILPTSRSVREKISDFLTSNTVQLLSVKWYNKAYKYYIQFILGNQDYFICFKDLKDIDNE